MIEDFRTAIEDGARLEFDLCIAGAGAAGITLARALTGAGYKIALVEGGGFTPPSDKARALYEGSVGERRYPLAHSRLRYFGGSTNHWGGWCRPLDDIDFKARDYVPLSGWPISRADLEPFYAKAHTVCEIEGDNYDARSVLRGSRDATLKFERASGFSNKLFRFSPPTRFGKVYRDVLKRAKDITVFLHANLVDIDTTAKRMQHFAVKTLDGKHATISAGLFVLGLGGIENARMLLHSNKRHPQGLGNASGFVGRCFMDHFGFRPGFALTRPELKYFRFASPSGSVMPVMSMHDDALDRHNMRNFCITIIPDSPNASFSPEALANPGFSELGDGAAKPWRYVLQFINEPTPNPDSRITLSDDRDALGMRKAHLDWQVHDDDLRNIERVVERLARYLGSQGLGRLQYTKLVEPINTKQLSTGMHHMGTTRISDDPTKGVVNADCRVHDIDNLYIAGSSVFPTSGFSNPTLTIVALAERLAKHLKNRLDRGQHEAA